MPQLDMVMRPIAKAYELPAMALPMLFVPNTPGGMFYILRLGLSGLLAFIMHVSISGCNSELTCVVGGLNNYQYHGAMFVL